MTIHLDHAELVTRAPCISDHGGARGDHVGLAIIAKGLADYAQAVRAARALSRAGTRKSVRGRALRKR